MWTFSYGWHLSKSSNAKNKYQTELQHFVNWKISRIIYWLIDTDIHENYEFLSFFTFSSHEEVLVLCGKFLSEFSLNLYVLRPPESEKTISRKCLSIVIVAYIPPKKQFLWIKETFLWYTVKEKISLNWRKFCRFKKNFFSINKSICLHQKKLFLINKTFYTSKTFFFFWPQIKKMFLWFKETVFSVSMTLDRILWK